MHVRHGHLSRRCVGTLDIDPTRPETLEGSSDGMLYGEVPLMTMRADKSSKLLGSIIIEFYLAQDGEDSEEDNNPYASFKFTFRKSSSPNRRSYGIEGASASSSKRQRDSEEASDQESARTKTEPTRKKRPSRIPKRPSRIRKRPRRYTSSDDELSESRSSLANLVSDALKLKDERVAIEKEERELRFLLEKRNSELRVSGSDESYVIRTAHELFFLKEQNQTRRADLADAKRAISGIV
ncbi:hypothetical protein QCA50_000359 [Cerrena zonata]|uniref:C2 NT-type domain-containing protein n=1 Tax=Cerrena zonata TaxID=2478898 RepID=A0AAW0GQN6_9APHY